MSFSLAMLKQMKAEGLDFDAAIRVLEADEPKIDIAAEKRRAWDRERKREAKRLSGGNSGGNPPDPSPNERDNLTPTRVTPPAPNGASAPKPKSKQQIPLPLNWQPEPLKPDGQAGQIVATWQPGRIERELSKFKDHALAGNVKHSDWDAAFRNWIKKADEFDERRTNTLGRHQSPDGLSSTARAAVAVFGAAPAR